MQRPQLALPFPGELIIDNFAGGGGTSTGLEAAFGRPGGHRHQPDPKPWRCTRESPLHQAPLRKVLDVIPTM
jgi:hypothetical protein